MMKGRRHPEHSIQTHSRPRNGVIRIVFSERLLVLVPGIFNSQLYLIVIPVPRSDDISHDGLR
jgi:hypothetical protein